MRISKKPIEKVFTIESEDYGKGTISIRQARVGDDILRKELVSEASLVINDEFLGQEIKQKINQGELVRFDIWLTLTACDFEEVDDEDNVIGSYFQFNGKRLANQTDFNIAYGKLPVVIADKIYEKVLEVNPQWKAQNNNDSGE